ncbi:hypothetical protein ACKVEX_16330 [Rhodocyclaceae bacterium SMB388]
MPLANAWAILLKRQKVARKRVMSDRKREGLVPSTARVQFIQVIGSQVQPGAPDNPGQADAWMVRDMRMSLPQCADETRQSRGRAKLDQRGSSRIWPGWMRSGSGTVVALAAWS